MNETYATLVGNLVADPVVTKNEGIRPVTRFRVAVTERIYNADLGKSIDGRTSFYQVSAWGNLGLNLAESARKGERVIVYGKLSIEQYRSANGETRTSASVEARAVGHDLTFGGTRFMKLRRDGEAGAGSHEVGADDAGADGAGADDPFALPGELSHSGGESTFDLADGEVPPYEESGLDVVDGITVTAQGERAPAY